MTSVKDDTLTAQLGKMNRAQLKSILSDNPEGARVWIYSLAGEGLAAAQVLYGSMLLDGVSVPQDQTAAVCWFSKAARQDDSDGLNMLGRCLEHGWGCELDDRESAECFKAAAQLGNTWGLYNLGHRYLDGLGIEQDFDAAYNCYLRAAELGHPRAMNLVGRCLEQGWGVAKDIDKAGLWYQKSADLGYFRGQFNWASLLFGKGLVEQAAVWFISSSRSMNPGIRQVVARLLEQHSHEGLNALREEFSREADVTC